MTQHTVFYNQKTIILVSGVVQTTLHPATTIMEEGLFLRTI